MTAPHRGWYDEPLERGAGLFDDARLFATGWFGGLVFFGTLFG